MLFSANADLNILNYKGQSALHLAAHAGLNESVQWLAEHVKPSFINMQDKHGRTAMYCAAHSNIKSTILILQDKGADASLRPFKYKKSQEAKVNSTGLVLNELMADKARDEQRKARKKLSVDAQRQPTGSFE